MAPRLVRTELPELLPMTRTPGNHVSHQIHKLMVRRGLREEREDGAGPQQFYLELGNSFEDGIAWWLANRIHRDQPHRFLHGFEMEWDGLFGTLDLLDVVDPRIIECKLTKMSSRHNIQSDKFWAYWVQLKCYVWMALNIGIIDKPQGTLCIGHLNANYDRNSEELVHYREWEDTWVTQELHNNWKMVKNA